MSSREIQPRCESKPGGFNIKSRRGFLRAVSVLTGGLFMEACLPQTAKEPAVSPATPSIPKREPSPSPTKTPKTYYPYPTVTSRAESLPTVEGKVRDYFPTAIGSGWTYEISIGDIEPLSANRIIVKGSPVIVERRRLLPSVKNLVSKTFSLSISIKEIVPYELLENTGWKMQVDKDDLDIFRGYEVYWIDDGLHFHISERIVYPRERDYSDDPQWLRPERKGGYSDKLIFFDERPGIGIRIMY